MIWRKETVGAARKLLAAARDEEKRRACGAPPDPDSPGDRVLVEFFLELAAQIDGDTAAPRFDCPTCGQPTLTHKPG